MHDKEFAKKLEERTRKFAVQIVRLSATLPNTPEGKVVKYQLTKCGTSVGANYREANRARSKAEFISGSSVKVVVRIAREHPPAPLKGGIQGSEVLHRRLKRPGRQIPPLRGARGV